MLQTATESSVNASLDDAFANRDTMGRHFATAISS
jgi:hypothetical protein